MPLHASGICPCCEDQTDGDGPQDGLWATDEELRIQRNAEVLLDEWGDPLPGHPGYEDFLRYLDEQHQAEIDAEYAWLRHAENQYDPDDEIEREREANDPFLIWLREQRED